MLYKEGMTYYLDRQYRLTIDDLSRPICVIKTYNNDKNDNSLSYIKFQITHKARVWIAYDSRTTRIPESISNLIDGRTSVISTDDVSLNAVGFDVNNGEVILPGNGNFIGSQSNYIVLIQKR